MQKFLIILTGAILAACSGQGSSPEPNSELAGRCTVLMETMESARKSVIEDGTVKRFCNCYSDHVSSLNQDDQDLHMAIWIATENVKASSDGVSELDDLNGMLRDRLVEGGSDYPFDLEQFDRIGGDLDAYGRRFNPDAGCPSS